MCDRTRGRDGGAAVISGLWIPSAICERMHMGGVRKVGTVFRAS